VKDKEWNKTMSRNIRKEIENVGNRRKQRYKQKGECKKIEKRLNKEKNKRKYILQSWK
jgi:hypothetical protein